MHANSSYRGNRTPPPTHTHTPIHKQTGPITIHCAAAIARSVITLVFAIFGLCQRFYCCTFSNPSAIYTKWCAQTFPPIFGLFANFDRNLAKIVEPPSDECENYVAFLKVQSLPKKTLQTASKSACKISGNAMRVRTVKRLPRKVR